MDETKLNSYFANLVLMLASACWQQLGKVPNPVSNKVEIELDHAQVTIEMLDMIMNKTKGNLTKDESQLISNTLADLRLNYADEVAKKQATEKKN